jgi:hypothetical protein
MLVGSMCFHSSFSILSLLLFLSTLWAQLGSWLDALVFRMLMTPLRAFDLPFPSDRPFLSYFAIDSSLYYPDHGQVASLVRYSPPYTMSSLF